MVTAGDLHVVKLLHPTVFAELRDQVEGETGEVCGADEKQHKEHYATEEFS